ncbi:MAG: FixH family protein [Thiobacillaceae bacterium]
MSTLASLFGGLLLVLVLYGALGWVTALPTALRAVLASSLPLIAYFIFILGRWPGLDVVAIHVSVYLAAGLILYMFTLYRRRNAGSLHWIPRLLIAFFVLLAIINASLLYISARGLPRPIARLWLPHGDTVNSGFSGVVAHGQEAAKAVSSELTRVYSAAQLGWRVEINGLLETAQAHQRISVKVLDRTGLPVSGLKAELRLARPGAADAQTPIPLAQIAVGEYGAVLDLPASGRWLIELRLMQDEHLSYRESREVMRP